MSMSLRDLAVCSRPALSAPHASTISRSTKKNRSSQRPSYAAHLTSSSETLAERVANGAGIGPGDDPLLGQHHEMRVVDRHQGRQQLRLGVFEVLAQDEADVVGVESASVSRQSSVVGRQSQSSVCSRQSQSAVRVSPSRQSSPRRQSQSGLSVASREESASRLELRLDCRLRLRLTVDSRLTTVDCHDCHVVRIQTSPPVASGADRSRSSAGRDRAAARRDCRRHQWSRFGSRRRHSPY